MEIDDPSDWPYPALSDIDRLLRCPICTDFYNTAVIISTCSHTFCSLCIRKALQQEETCPQCRKPAQENKLINCIVVNQLIEKFVGARQILLEAARICKNSQSASSSSAQNALVQEGDMFSVTNSISQLNIPTIPISKQTKNTPVWNTSLLPMQSSSLITNTAIKPESETMIQPSDDAPVECPICAKEVTVYEVNWHLDNTCDSQPPARSIASSSTLGGFSGVMQSRNPSLPLATLKSGERKKHPKIVYNICTEKELRKILRDMGLPDHGNKRALKERHQYYLVLYNAEQDKPNPRNEADLRQELENWERNAEASKFTSASKTITEQDVEDHKRKYRDHFTELIKDTEKRKKPNTERNSNIRTIASIQSSQNVSLHALKEDSEPTMFSSPTTTRVVQSKNMAKHS